VVSSLAYPKLLENKRLVGCCCWTKLFKFMFTIESMFNHLVHVCKKIEVIHWLHQISWFGYIGIGPLKPRSNKIAILLEERCNYKGRCYSVSEATDKFDYAMSTCAYKCLSLTVIQPKSIIMFQQSSAPCVSAEELLSLQYRIVHVNFSLVGLCWGDSLLAFNNCGLSEADSRLKPWDFLLPCNNKGSPMDT
jgi:hypothetical protein